MYDKYLFQERREIERLVVKGLSKLDGDLEGEYFPLAGILVKNFFTIHEYAKNLINFFSGSRSFEAKPTGMSHEKEEYLRGKGNLFQEPDSTLLLSSGCGRHWPDARGIFHNKDRLKYFSD